MNDSRPAAVSVSVGDVDIPYLAYESSEGPPLVLLHATGFNPWLWHPVARELKNRFQVYCPYFCDHREADPEAGGMDWLVLGRDLHDFCETLDLEDPYLVGHSMGGAVSAIAAGHFGLAPSSMVLIEPILLPRGAYAERIRVEEHPLAGKAIKRRNHWEGRDEARRYLFSKPLFRNWAPEVLELYFSHGFVESDEGGLTLTCPPVMEAALFMGSMGFDPWPALSSVACPVLVLEGEQTENKGFIDYKAVSAAFPEGTYREVPGAGHLIPMEMPKQTAEYIRSFFQDTRNF
jgi:pimeloyl-ACP methyl ester carboxylesterase